jgi:hypothetical protein
MMMSLKAIDELILGNCNNDEQKISRIKDVFKIHLDNEDEKEQVAIRKFLIDKEKESGKAIYKKIRDELTSMGVEKILTSTNIIDEEIDNMEVSFKKELAQLLRKEFDISYSQYLSRVDYYYGLPFATDYNRYNVIYGILGVFTINYERFGSDDSDNSINDDIGDDMDYYQKEWAKDNDVMLDGNVVSISDLNNEELMCLGLLNFIKDFAGNTVATSHGNYVDDSCMDDDEYQDIIYYKIGSLDRSMSDYFTETGGVICDKNNSFYHTNGDYASNIYDRYPLDY